MCKHQTGRRALLLPLLLLLVLLFGTTDHLSAQSVPSSTATILSPANNATNVSRTPTIIVRTGMPIYPGSLNYEAPDKDSVTYNLRATIMVIPKVVADSLPYEAWDHYAASGVLTLVNDSTLTFAVNHLQYSTEYKVIVDSLYTQFGGPPMRFSTINSSFRTIDPPHEILSTSLDGFNVIDCNDRVLVAFNRTITSATTSAGPLMDLELIVSTDTSGNIQTTSASAMLGVSTTDPNVVFIKPTPAVPGQHYLLNINASYLNGDPNTDVQLHFFIQNGYRINMNAVLQGSSASLPYGIKEQIRDGETYYDISDTVKLVAIPELGDVRFFKWICPQLPLLHQSTSSTFSFVQQCQTVTNLTITAVYKKIQSTTVTVETEPGLNVFVYDRELNLIGTTGTYTVLNSTRDSITVIAQPVGSYTFATWTSSPFPPPPPPYNPFDKRIKIKYSATGSFVRGTATLNPMLATYSLSGAVVVDDGNSSVYTFTTPQSYTEFAPASRPIGITITDNCYEIYKSEADGVVQMYDPGVPSVTRSGQLKLNGNLVTIYVRKKKIHLRIEQVMLENTLTEVEDLVTKVSHHNATEVYKLVNGQWEGPLVAAIEFDNGRPFKDYEFTCGDEVKVVCNDDPDKGHHFSHWSDNIANYVSPGDRSSRVFQLTISDNIAKFTAADGHKQIRTRACFHMVFRLVEIGLHLLKTDGTFDLEYFPPDKVYVKRDDEPKDGRQVQYMTGEGTRIHLRFNQPYHKPSVELWGVYASRVQEGIKPGPDVIPSSMGNQNLSHIIQDGFQEANELIFALHTGEGGLAASKMSYYRTNVTSTVTNKALTPLDNDMNFTIELELPSVTLTYKKLKIHHNDEDPNTWLLFGTIIDRGDMYSIFQSGMMGPDGNGNGVIKRHEPYKGRLPCTDCTVQLEVGEEYTPNFTLLASGERMTHHGYIFSHVETKDEDTDELVNAIGSILDGVGDLIDEITLPALPENKDASGTVQPPGFWTQALYDNALKVGSKLFHSIGKHLEDCDCNKDDHIGSAHLFLGKYDRWGKASSANNKMHFRDHNSEYWFETTLD